jgi:cell cycle sensor histidine kinase DivJ
LSNAFKKSIGKLTNAISQAPLVASQAAGSRPVLHREAVAALQCLPDSASLHKANGDALWLSDKSTVLFKQTEEQILGKGYLDKVNPQDKLLILKAFSDAAATDQNQIVRFRSQFYTLDCEDNHHDLKHFEIRISPYHAGGMLLALVRDVTQEEEALYNARQNEEKAESANSTKSLFLSNISHELRTPLNAIIGFSQLLSGEAAIVITDEKKHEYAELINQSASHLLTIINDLLDLSKIEAGKFQVIPELMNPHELLLSTVKLMNPIADEAGISLSAKLQDNLPEITADPRAVKQILINLIANAVKFSGEGAQVKVSLKRELRKVCFKISDTGMGMDEGTLEKLGNSFFQAEQHAAKGHEGTGLGLSIVFGLVKLHDGNISFKSHPGNGTTVQVELPISNEKTVPVPSDPNDGIVFLNEMKEPNLMRKLNFNSTRCKTG